MELVYLWVEDYKNIHKQGFNFSPQFNCKFHDEYEKYTDANGNEKERLKDNCKLDIEPKKHIENFFGENINVTAIVGKNGSGKSSVLEYIRELITLDDSRHFSIKSNSFLLYYINEKFTLINNSDIAISSTKKINGDSFLNIFSYSAEMPYNSFSFFYEELSGDLLLTPEEFEEMKIQHYLDLGIERIGEILADSQHREYSKIIYTFNPIRVILRNNDKFTEMIRSNLKNYIAKNIDLNEFNNDLAYLIDKVLEYYFNSLEILLLDILIRNSEESDISSFIYELEDIGDYSAGTSVFFERLYYFLLGNNLLETSSYINGINIDEYYRLLDKNILFKDLPSKEVFKNYKRVLIFDFIDEVGRKYSDLSYGEKNLFGQMINFQYRINNELRWTEELYILNKKIDGNTLKEKVNFVFLIDEPDISLHPQWQKEYLDILNKIINSLDVNIHIVLTTHSPFLLSDIPKQNIIFLDKDENGKCIVVDGLKEKKQTFGANIHTLLSDSFFMKDGLMGEFAKGKINEIKRFYEKVVKENKEETSDLALLAKEYKENKIKFEQIQSIIGEPFLKKVIKNYLDELELLFSDDNTLIEKELADIEKRKVYLESLKNAKN